MFNAQTLRDRLNSEFKNLRSVAKKCGVDEQAMYRFAKSKGRAYSDVVEKIDDYFIEQDKIIMGYYNDKKMQD